MGGADGGAGGAGGGPIDGASTKTVCAGFVGFGAVSAGGSANACTSSLAGSVACGGSSADSPGAVIVGTGMDGASTLVRAMGSPCRTRAPLWISALPTSAYQYRVPSLAVSTTEVRPRSSTNDSTTPAAIARTTAPSVTCRSA